MITVKITTTREISLAWVSWNCPGFKTERPVSRKPLSVGHPSNEHLRQHEFIQRNEKGSICNIFWTMARTCVLSRFGEGLFAVLGWWHRCDTWKTSVAFRLGNTSEPDSSGTHPLRSQDSPETLAFPSQPIAICKVISPIIPFQSSSSPGEWKQ